MRRYHHIGIPLSNRSLGDSLENAKVPDLVRLVPHVAFEVTDLSSELAGRDILIPPNSPSDGVRVAFIVENGAPIELLEFTDPKHPARISND
jgi:hypothetical protein